jgi:hypothetical protein
MHNKEKHRSFSSHKYIGLEVNAEDTTCSCPMNRMQDKIKTNIGNKSFEGGQS